MIVADDALFQRYVGELYAGRARPMTVILELTRRCNLRCAHCYAAVERGRPELPVEELEGLIDSARRLGALFVLLIGGDPTVNRGFLRLVHHAGDRALAVQIFTNGTLIDERTADALAAEPVFHVAVSLYGARAETHDAIVGRRGAWARTVAGIRRLGTRVPTVIKFLVMRSNLGEVEEVERLAADWGVEVKFNATVVPRDDGEPGRWDQRLGLKDLTEWTRRRGSGPPAPVREDRRDLACLMGRSLVAVNAYGDVFPCIMVPIPAGNVRYTPLEEIWASSPFLRYVRELRHVARAHACGGCGYRGECSRCPGITYMETGDLFGPSPSACLAAVARRRASGGLADPPPPGMVHADSRLWNVHDMLATVGFGCAEASAGTVAGGADG